jgi:hypothetical protein
MALANVAWILASAGKRVLTIDWDLEAPGLHRYFQPFLIDKELSGQESQGVIDMVIDFAVRAATPKAQGQTLSSTWYEAYADFSKWQQKLRWPSGQAVQFGVDGQGGIEFVPAGRQSADYANRVNNFDWQSFYEKLGGGAFFDAAKRRFVLYDYVLIDSRTGVSDTSGICTIHLPDTLVVCFTLNFQSIKGAAAVAQSVKEHRPEMRFLPVPMRIDAGEEKSLNRMKSYAAEVFNPFLESSIDRKEYWFSMEVPYHPRYAYAEKLALFEDQASITASTLPAMVRLSRYVTAGEVKTAGPLPDLERKLALAEFEGLEPAEGSLTASPAKANSETLEVGGVTLRPATHPLLRERRIADEKHDHDSSTGSEMEIYLSYRRLDNSTPTGSRGRYGFVDYLVRNVRSRLEEDGVPDVILWQDRSLIEPGDVWSEEILNALNRAEFFIVILSKNYVKSEWCEKELACIIERSQMLDGPAWGRRIVRVDKHWVREDQIPEALRDIQAVRFYREDNEAKGVDEFFWGGKVRLSKEYDKALLELTSAIGNSLEGVAVNST